MGILGVWICLNEWGYLNMVGLEWNIHPLKMDWGCPSDLQAPLASLQLRFQRVDLIPQLAWTCWTCCIHIWLDFINCRAERDEHILLILHIHSEWHILTSSPKWRRCFKNSSSHLPTRAGWSSIVVPCCTSFIAQLQMVMDEIYQRQDIQELTIQQVFEPFILRFLEIGGTPVHHPFIKDDFHFINHPAIGRPPWLWKATYQFIKVSPAPKLHLSGAFHFQLQLLGAAEGERFLRIDLDHPKGIPIRLNSYQFQQFNIVKITIDHR